MEVENLGASHPRVAASYRRIDKQVDTQTGRQQVKTRTSRLHVTSRRRKCQVLSLFYLRMAPITNSHGRAQVLTVRGLAAVIDNLAQRPQRSSERAKKTAWKDVTTSSAVGKRRQQRRVRIRP